MYEHQAVVPKYPRCSYRYDVIKLGTWRFEPSFGNLAKLVPGLLSQNNVL